MIEIPDPDYWRITDAVEKVIAKHTFMFNCEQIMGKSRADNNPFSAFIYMGAMTAEIVKFRKAISHTSKPMPAKSEARGFL